MAVSKRIKEITFGGSGANNPPGYSWTTLDNYPDLDLSLVYQRFNIIIFHTGLGVPLEVTGLIVVSGGVPLLGPNDLVFPPCPPSCT